MLDRCLELDFLGTNFKGGACGTRGTKEFAKIQQISLLLGRDMGAAVWGAWFCPSLTLPWWVHPPSGPHPLPPAPQCHRGHLGSSTCILFAFLRIPILQPPAPGPWPGSEPDPLASPMMFKENISCWRGLVKGPEKKNRIKKQVEGLPWWHSR